MYRHRIPGVNIFPWTLKQALCCSLDPGLLVRNAMPFQFLILSREERKMDVNTVSSFCFKNIYFIEVPVQSLSCVQLFVTPWTAACQASLSITNSWSLPKPMSIESVMPSNHLILCCPLLLLPSIFPSIRVFSKESVLHIRWPKYCSFSFNISPSIEHSGLISFRMDWLDPPCSPRHSQESSPTPQFKSINSSALSFIYSPTLTSIHEYWKNHSLD